MGGKQSKVGFLAKAARQAETRLGKMVVTTRCHHLPRRIEDDYEPLPEVVLGTGSTATVRPWKHRATGCEVAVKSFEFAGFNSESRESAARECEILLSVDHPNVCRTRDVYESTAALHLVMEKISGGDLCSHVEQQPLDEATAIKLTKQALSALAYLHCLGIAHRDVKLENMIYDPQGEGHIQLIDFGVSDSAGGDVGFAGYVGGSLPYAAPEILRGKPCYKSDVWSIGVCVFAMLTGALPFAEEGGEELAAAISSGRVTSTAAWEKLSAGARSFVSELLSVSISKRPSAREALRHSWLQHPCDDLDPAVLDAMVGFAKVDAARRCCLLAAAWSVPSSDCAEAHEAFSQLDRTRRGTISAEDMLAVLPGDSARLALKALDQNGVKRIHYSEFLAALLAADVVPLRDEVVSMTYWRIGRDRLMSFGLDVPIGNITRGAQGAQGQPISQEDFALFVYDDAELESIQRADHSSFSSFEHQSLSELPEFEPQKPGAALHSSSAKSSLPARHAPAETWADIPHHSALLDHHNLFSPHLHDSLEAGFFLGAPISGL